jgi:hypothetical protein
MMEIVREGNVSLDWSATFKCIGNSSRGQNGTSRGCGAELKVTENDLVTRHDFGTHFRHDYLALKCPLCGEFSSVRKDEVPARVFENRHDPNNSTFDGEDYSIY